jgi:ABC-type multidrug transport system fused ATPase/permease subunit
MRIWCCSMKQPPRSIPNPRKLVQDAIAHLTQGRTTIVIAHRLHTVAHADRILVIENGAVTESGRHEELLRKERPLCLALSVAAQG